MADAVFLYPYGLALAPGNALWNANLIAAWDMDLNWLDKKGSNHGTRFGSGTQFDTVNQKLGSAAGLFVAGNSNYVNCGAAAGIPTSASSWTIGGWASTLSATRQGIISRMRGSTWDWYLEIRADGSARVAIVNTGGALYASVIGGSSLNDGEPHHIVAVWDVDTKLELFVDKVSVGSDTSFTGTKRLDTPDVWIGEVDSNYFDGWLDELFIRNDVLLLAELEALYDEQNTPTSVTIPNFEELPLERPPEKFQSAQVLGGGDIIVQDLGKSVTYIKINTTLISAAKYAELVLFFQNTINYMEKTFTYTDQLGIAYSNVRLTNPSWHLPRVTNNPDGQYKGSFLIKTDPA